MAKYYNETKVMIELMLKIYKTYEYDWMSYSITSKNKLTYHHIVKECNGGVFSLDNGALLTKKAHRLLNMLEEKNYILYETWNELFKEINVRKEPMDEYLLEESKVLKLCTHNVIYGYNHF